MIGRPAGMKRVPINPPRGHDPLQHQVVGEVHSWDPPKIITAESPSKERLEKIAPDE